ncbi:MAG: hypothetical protein K2L23_01815 [Odoribacter sp.]|nr:hypothetical protein [Odoribacter sp.]
MKRLLILNSLLLVSILVLRAQDTTSSSKWEGQYFKYTAAKNSIGVSPLFASSPVSDPSMIFAEVNFLNKDYTNRNWTEFITIFVEQVLKKHLTIDEIRLLKDENGYVMARMLFYFNYSGDILYATLIFRKQLARILTEEKLYAIYQGLMKLKVDTEGFLWWTKNGKLTSEEQKRAFVVVELPFFNKHNCP